MMNEPLPADVVERVRCDFGDHADAVMETLLLCRRFGSSSDYFSDRLLRCVVFAARGDESRIRDLILLGRQDLRDLIVAAEYDPLAEKQLRDFNHPFGSEDSVEVSA